MGGPGVSEAYVSGVRTPANLPTASPIYMRNRVRITREPIRSVLNVFHDPDGYERFAMYPTTLYSDCIFLQNKQGLAYPECLTVCCISQATVD